MFILSMPIFSFVLVYEQCTMCFVNEQVAVDTEEYDDAAELSEKVDELSDQLGQVRHSGTM